MTTPTQAQVARANQAGYQAASNGRPRAPALDKTLMGIIAEINGPVGSGISILDAFAKGFQAHCDEKAAEIIAS